MGITVTWDNAEKSIIRWDIEGKWTWDEYYRIDAQAREMTRSIPQNIVGIVDVENSLGIPPDTLGHMRRIANNPIPNLSFTVVVGASRVVTTFYRIYQTLYSAEASHFVFANSLNEARTKASMWLAEQ